MKRIGIIRGLMPRTTHAEFASQFKKLAPILITGKGNSEVIDYCIANNVEHIDLPVHPFPGMFFDPVYALT